MPVLIENIWMAVAVDPIDHTEGLCAVKLGNEWYPLIAADLARLPFVKQEAKNIAFNERKKVKLIRLTKREEVEVFDG
jgi:hypothetical protein